MEAKIRWNALMVVVTLLSLGMSACGTVPDATPGSGTVVPIAPTTAPATPTGTPDPTSDPTPADPTPTPTGTTPPTPAPTCTDLVGFDGDVTIPDGTVLAPGQSFVKTWRLRNVGTCTWTTDYALAFVSGNRLGGPSAVRLSAAVQPDGAVDVSVTLAAPETAGSYEGRWQLRNADGELFGLGRKGQGSWRVSIVVAAPTATPVPPSPAPSPTTPAPGAAWRGEYWANAYLTGSPAVYRNTNNIDFDWGWDSPDAGLPVDGFSARWSGEFNMQEATYRFHVLVDDGARVYIDDKLILDEWRQGQLREVTVEYPVTRGQHTVWVEYYEYLGHARIHFWWEKLAAPSYPQWKGEYWSLPSPNGPAELIRNDSSIDFDWDTQSPAVGISEDEFSARWTRTIDLSAGSYRFYLVVNDGGRVRLDGTLIIDEWHDGALRSVSFDSTVQGGNHTLQVEYYDRTGAAEIHFWWEQQQPIFTDWKGEYWTNRRFSGSPALARNDVAIDFDWRQGSPAAGLPEDKFAVRWTRQVTFSAGTYTFHAQADDGLRFYLDGELVLDAWPTSGAARVYSVEKTLSGTHTLVVEYYDFEGRALVEFGW